MVPADWIIENDLYQILYAVLEYFVREGLSCFWQPNILL